MNTSVNGGDVLGGGAKGGASGKKFHSDRLKLFVEVCEKWVLFGSDWKTSYIKDAHALMDLGLLEYVRMDGGYMVVKPSADGLGRYNTIIAGIFGEK